MLIAIHPFKEYGIAAADPRVDASAGAQAAAIQTAHSNSSNINLKTCRGERIWASVPENLRLPGLSFVNPMTNESSGVGMSKPMSEFKVPSNVKSANPELLGIAASGRAVASA